MERTLRLNLVRFVALAAVAWALVLAPLTAKAELDKSEAVTLTITSVPGGTVALLEYAAESFKKAYPNVTIEVIDYENDWYNQNAIRMFNSSDRPDLAFFWLTGFYHSLVASGALLPLDDFFEEAGLNDVLQPSSINVATAKDGVKYGVPFNSIMSPVLMYNKDAFDEAGITKEPDTMEEFLALGPKLREAGYIPWTSGLASASQATQLFDINIRRYTDDETYDALMAIETMDYTQPDIVDAFRNMQKMAEVMMEPGTAGVENLAARSLFAQGRAAIYSDGTWNLGPAALHGEIPENFRLGIMTYPLGREGTKRTTGFYDASGLVIPKGTGKEDWAKAFIAHVVSFEVQSTMGSVMAQTPVRNDIPVETLVETYHPDVAAIYTRVLSEGTHRIFNTAMPGAYRPAATQLIQGLVGGQLSPEEFAALFSEMVQSLH